MSTPSSRAAASRPASASVDQPRPTPSTVRKVPPTHPSPQPSPPPPSSRPVPPPNLNDDEYWRPALARMVLEPAQFLAPIDPSSPFAHLPEAEYVTLAPRILDEFPSLNHLRYKLVPSRISEEAYWRHLFHLISLWHAADVPAPAPSATLPKKAIIGQPTVRPVKREHTDAHASWPSTPRSAASQAQQHQPLPPAPLSSPVHGNGLLSPPSHSPQLKLALPPLPTGMFAMMSPPALPPFSPSSSPPSASAASAASIAAAAASAQEIHSLQAALASKDALLASRQLEIDLLQTKLQLVLGQLGHLAGIVASSVAVANANVTSLAELERLAAAHLQHARPNHGAMVLQHLTTLPPAPTSSSADAMPTPPTMAAAPAAVTALPASASIQERTQTAPAPSSAAASSSSSPPPPAVSPAPTLACARCHELLDGSTASAAAAGSVCRAHSGAWSLTKDSAEFFDLPPELRQSLRKEKARRLAAVRHEMRFIIESDDHTTAPGSWTCCKADEYATTGCKRHQHHQPQPVK